MSCLYKGLSYQKNFKNYEFLVQRLSLKSVIQIRNLKTKYLQRI